MKNLIVVIVLSLFSINLFGQTPSIKTFYDKYMKMDEVTEITLKGWLIKMAASSVDDEDEKNLLEKISQVRILVMEDGNIVSKDELKGLIRNLKNENFEELMTVRDEGTKVEILIKEEGDSISNVLLLVHEEDNFVLLSLEGLLKFSDLNNIDLDIDGGKHFKKIPERKRA